ncbi:MAG: L-glutamate gamma-semialdehyde dehydrogenase [Candidatus Xenobiia bacterium LiM19]
MFGIYKLQQPKNEPIIGYAPGTPERKALKEALSSLGNSEIEIPLIIGGKEVRTGDMGQCIIPHNHRKVLARYHKAGEKEIKAAIEAAINAKREWESFTYQERVTVFLKAAELLTKESRFTVNAATMLGQSKTAYQAEIDSACELADFFRFNAYFATLLYEQQPISGDGMWNFLEYRPLDGFVLAVSPFNFTAIGGNLCSAPALMGNTVLWKPAANSLYSAHHVMNILLRAGLPPGVINLIAGQGSLLGPLVLKNRDLSGIHFTGSTAVFNSMWKTVARELSTYLSYPRLVGETGGKDFIFAHQSCDTESLIVALARGAFEYQGQKCSAASRAYIPESLWPEVKKHLLEKTAQLKVGDVEDFTCFMGAVIDRNAFDSITGFIEKARSSSDGKIIAGGTYDDQTGYFIDPTIIETTNPRFVTMEKEIFGPVITIYVYKDSEYLETLRQCDSTSPYALTGAIFANDRRAIKEAYETLRYSAGNFYINDKPTGAVVGQQPFGGARGSGTNDKAGSFLNLIRWTSPRTVKENFCPSRALFYPSMEEA